MSDQLIQAKTRAGFDSAKSQGQIASDEIAFIEDTRQIYAKDKFYTAIPAGGSIGQILTWKADGQAQWTSLDIVDMLAYGVEWDITVADPTLTRIGNILLHKQLPIQSALRGCVAQGDQVVYYLNADNWAYKEDGTASRLDGYDGNVMVEVPDFYFKGYNLGNKRRFYLSTQRIDSTWSYFPKCLVAAYRNTVLNTVPENMGYLSTLPVNSAISVVNTSTYCRGGGNRVNYDQYLDSDPFRTDLGKPRTNITRADMRTYARNAKAEMLSYEQYKDIFYWLWVVEYATFNSQLAYNEDLTSEGFRQGGAGTSMTDGNYNYQTYYNGNYPVTPCGYGNDLGNHTGIKNITINMPTQSGGSATSAQSFQMYRWRGFDNIFGDIWTGLEGYIADTPLEGASDPSILPTAYIITNPDNYTDSLDDIEEKAARSFKMPHSEGDIKQIFNGQYGDTVPEAIGGSTSTYHCDHYWINYNNTPKTLVVGGSLAYGAQAGLSSFSSNDLVSGRSARRGFRSIYQNKLPEYGLSDDWEYLP